MGQTVATQKQTVATQKQKVATQKQTFFGKRKRAPRNEHRSGGLGPLLPCEGAIAYGAGGQLGGQLGGLSVGTRSTVCWLRSHEY